LKKALARSTRSIVNGTSAANQCL